MTLMGLGNGHGEGVQSADAAWQTQICAYLNWVGFLVGADVKLPLIRSNFLGVVGDTTFRSRIFPYQTGSIVAVSGARVSSLLNRRASATTVAQIDSEIDLVLFPRQQSQIEAVESAQPDLVICWIGNNDALGAVTSFNELNASQLTPVADFERYFRDLVDRLGALVTQHGTRVVFANIPDVTRIGFLIDRDYAEDYLGFSVDLPDGHLTTIVGLLLMQYDGNDNLMSEPNYVLDDSEVIQVRSRVAAFNDIIERQTQRIGMPVVDIYSMFDDLIRNPPVIMGLEVTAQFMGGFFSLDGVHPSNTGHALLANEFVGDINQAFGTNFQPIPPQILEAIVLTDPHVDKDRDGKVIGRLGVGLLETLAFVLGISGDLNDAVPDYGTARRGSGSGLPAVSPFSRFELVRLFMQIYGSLH